MQGSQTNPIPISDSLPSSFTNLSHQTTKHSLYKAHMGTDFDVLVQILKLQLPGTPQQKTQTLLTKLNQFLNHQYKIINISQDYFRPRQTPNYSFHQSIIPIYNQLILYGVDFLTTKQIRRRFQGIYLSDIVWLDDSHCKVIFKNANDAKKGLQMNILPTQQLNSQPQQFPIPTPWFQLHPYSYLNSKRSLFSRYATKAQPFSPHPKPNQLLISHKAKKLFETSIKTYITKQKYFNAMIQYGLINYHHSKYVNYVNNLSLQYVSYRQKYGNYKDIDINNYEDCDKKNINTNMISKKHKKIHKNNIYQQHHQQLPSRSTNKQKPIHHYHNHLSPDKKKLRQLKSPRKQLKIKKNSYSDPYKYHYNKITQINQIQSNVSFMLNQSQISSHSQHINNKCNQFNFSINQKYKNKHFNLPSHYLNQSNLSKSHENNIQSVQHCKIFIEKKNKNKQKSTQIDDNYKKCRFITVIDEH